MYHYKLAINQCPSGKFEFVGSVPACLAYSGATQQDLKDIIQVGPGMIMKRRKNIKSLSWDTEDEARKFAKSKGYEV